MQELLATTEEHAATNPLRTNRSKQLSISVFRCRCNYVFKRQQNTLIIVSMLSFAPAQAHFMISHTDRAMLQRGSYTVIK